jgi:hypothetical protein
VDTAELAKKVLTELYGQNTEKYCKQIICEWLKRKRKSKAEIRTAIREYLIRVSENTLDEIEFQLLGGTTNG